jgi:hypothetical protein
MNEIRVLKVFCNSHFILNNFHFFSVKLWEIKIDVNFDKKNWSIIIFMKSRSYFSQKVGN